MTGVEPRDARGFSIAERPLPAVVANNADPVAARSFTIVHELVHVAMREGGICDLANRGRVEPFCNRVAGAVLVPARSLIAEQVVREHGADVEWQDVELQHLARRYGVSREVVLRRLLILGRTDDSFYRQKRQELLDEYEQRVAERRTPAWGPSPATAAVVRAGHLFSRLVLSSYSRGGITASDVAAYLGVRMKHVPRIERAVFGRARE
jgi:Zn-dependent peptidase ImmA (M78 family)